MSYQVKDYSHLKGIGKISDEAMQMHFKLYEGYVKNTNILLEKLKSPLTPLYKEGNSAIEQGSAEWNELHRRFGWEWNGMRLHELFFDSLTTESVTPPLTPPQQGGEEVHGEIKNKIVENFGSVDIWKKDFLAMAKMRGMGWAMLVQDLKTGKLINTWVNEHDAGMMSDVKIILNIDMFEHAYVKDFGTDRAPYLDSIFSHIDWAVVSERLM